MRVSTGLPNLDGLLGGGLIPGTLTAVVGATGIGKSQLGMHFAQEGLHADSSAAAIVDLCSRGDSQSHGEYSDRMFGRRIRSIHPADIDHVADLSPGELEKFDRLELFTRSGLKTRRQDIDPREWDDWQVHVNRSLHALVGFLYHRFAQGCRRVVVDGFEPATRQADSIQFEMFEYIYHQILRKESDWVARDLYRQRFLRMQEEVAGHAYDHRQLTCLALYTSNHAMLDELIRQPLDDGDLLANANTLVFMGKVAEGTKMGRALHVAKHRGSACSDAIHRFTIDAQGIVLGSDS